MREDHAAPQSEKSTIIDNVHDNDNDNDVDEEDDDNDDIDEENKAESVSNGRMSNGSFHSKR